MDKLKKVEIPIQITDKSGIDLEAAYMVLLKAFIRIQTEQKPSEEKGEDNAIRKEVQTA